VGKTGLQDLAKRLWGAGQMRAITPGTPRKRDQEIFISQEIFEHAGEEIGLERRFTNRVRRNTRRGDKAAKPLLILGKKGKRLNSQDFGCRLRMMRNCWHRALFAFPQESQIPRLFKSLRWHTAIKFPTGIHGFLAKLANSKPGAF